MEVCVESACEKVLFTDNDATRGSLRARTAYRVPRTAAIRLPLDEPKGTNIPAQFLWQVITHGSLIFLSNSLAKPYAIAEYSPI